MALNRWGAGFVIGAKDMASAVFGQVGKNFNKLTKGVEDAAKRQEMAMRSVAVGGTLLALGGGMARALTGMVDVSSKYEAAVAAVGAVSGATAEELQLLKDAAIEAGIRTQFSPTEATMGLQELSQAGFNAKESIQLLTPVLDLAAGSLGQLSPQEAAGLAAQGMKAFGLSINEAGPAVDKMLQAVNVFALNANELPMALGTASRGAQSFKQSLDETLISLGLVKNVIPSVERASTAVAVAMEKMVDPETQQRIQGLGVRVTDSKKRFRDFLTIIGEMAPKLNKMNEQQRSAWMLQTFGREALGGVNAIMTQLTEGVRDNTGATVKGAAAIKYLREQFANAGGTAAMFSSKLLDTLEGQKKLLRGSLETLYIVAGEPLAKAMKPVISFIVDGLNRVLMFFKNLPDPVKKTIMGILSVVSGLTALFGGVMILKGAMGMLGVSTMSVIMTIGQLLIIGPAVVLLMGGLGIAAYAMYRAFTKNTAGIADSWKTMVAKIKLAWDGIIALVTTGKLSAELEKELAKAENSGVMKFLKGFELFLERMRYFWEGLKAGFETGVNKLAESSAMKRLLSTMDTVFGMFTGDKLTNSQEALADWGKQGEKTGEKLAKLGEIALNALNYIIDLGKRFAEFASTISAEDVSSGINTAIDTFRGLWETLKAIVEVIGWISDAVRVVVNLLQTAAAFIAETFGAYFNFLKTGASVVGKISTGNFSGAKDEVMKFVETPIYDETRKQAGDVIRVFDPKSRVGLEEEDRARANKKALQGLMEQRRKTSDLLAQRQAEGGDTAAIVEHLKTLNDTIWEISKRPPPPLNVTLDADRVAASTREADARDRTRSLEEIPDAMGF